MCHVPNDVPREPGALRALLEDLKFDNRMVQHEALKTHYQAAMSELHYVPEVQLLERISAGLGDNSTHLEIPQPFHALCFNLLKQADVDIPDELRAAHDKDDWTADQHEREKRNCFRPTQNICGGLCGLGCSCWSWFCGDCCWHRGCYEHDLYCKKSRFSSDYVNPLQHGFTCAQFKGYPRCMQSGGWCDVNAPAYACWAKSMKHVTWSRQKSNQTNS